MKLKRIISLCAVVVFGASTAIYAGNVSKTEEKTAEESFEQENKDSMSENEQLAGVELSMPENKDPGEHETETTKKNMIEESTEQQKSIETINVAGAVENAANPPQETKTENFDPQSLIPPGNEEGWAEFQISDDTDYLPFEVLVSPGDIIMFQGGYQETVDEVYPDGSFTTDYSSDTVWEK